MEIEEIKKKKEFNELPDSLIKRAAGLSKDVKEARAILRKYFTVFLTNRIVKGKLNFDEILKKHISSKQRDYDEVYLRILKNEKTIIDLGAGVNGFSYKFLEKHFNGKYIAIEAAKVLVDLMNKYFLENKFNAKAYWEDLFNLNKIIEIIKEQEKPVAVFLFNIIDALEYLERDYSKKLILEVANCADKLVLSFPVSSISGKTKFKAKRYWILNFISENFKVLDDFISNGERFIVFCNQSLTDN